jgi:hypothetical protein
MCRTFSLSGFVSVNKEMQKLPGYGPEHTPAVAIIISEKFSKLPDIFLLQIAIYLVDHYGLHLIFTENSIFSFKNVYYTVNANLQAIPVITSFFCYLPAGCFRPSFGRTFFGFIAVHNFPT